MPALTLRVLLALYRATLVLYPASFRARFGSGMVRAFADGVRGRASARGSIAAVLWAMRAVADAIGSGLAERRLLRRRAAIGRSPGPRLREVVQDLRCAIRQIRRRPGLAALSILTLGVGIGASSAVFSILDASLLRPLNLPEPAEIVTILETNEGRPSQVSFDNWSDWKSQATSFEALALLRPQTINLTGVSEPAPVRGAFVAGDFFGVAGVPPARGRPLGPADDRPDAPPSAVISHWAWQRYFAGRDDIVGQPIHLNNIAFTIAGVMPAGFYFPYDNARVWVPVRFGPSRLARSVRSFVAFGRLRDGVPIDEARVELAGIAASLAAAFPGTNANSGARIDPLHSFLTSDVRQPLAVVFGLALLLAAAACANVTSLQLGATAGRRSEIAVRTALGAGRTRIARQLVVEHLVLALFGGALGLLLAGQLVPLAVAYSPLDVFGLYRAALDWRVVAFAAAATIVAGLISGLVPAVHWAGQPAAAALGSGARASGDRQLTRTRAWLVGGQVAMAAVLLTAGGMLVKSYLALTAVAPGFSAADQLLTMEYRLPANRYDTAEKQLQFHEGVVQRIAAVPGIRGAALVRALPFSGNGNVVTYLTEESPGAAQRQAEFNTISDEYFRLMRIPVLAGRTFDARDRADAPPAIVVSRSFAEQAWPGESALGREIMLPGLAVRPRVVGVVGDVRHRALTETTSPAFYARTAQSPGVFMTIVAETIGDPLAHRDAVKHAVWEIDPNQPVWKERTLASLVDGSVQPMRSMFGALAIFACAALLLVIAGMYGVISQSVNQRTREIGVRMALGADRIAVLRDVLARGLRLTLIGLAVGLIVSIWLSRLLGDMLFRTTPLDPLPYAATAALLAAIATLSSYLPARRAASIDPAITLRT
jgi:putative ABC transport system permease protein